MLGALLDRVRGKAVTIPPLDGPLRANTALEAPAMVPEFKLWLASEYVPIWQATEAWMEEQNIDPPYWAFCWPGGQAIARYLLDHPEAVRGKRVIDFAAGSGVSSIAAAHVGAVSVIAVPPAVVTVGLNGVSCP